MAQQPALCFPRLQAFAFFFHDLVNKIGDYIFGFFFGLCCVRRTFLCLRRQSNTTNIKRWLFIIGWASKWPPNQYLRFQQRYYHHTSITSILVEFGIQSNNHFFFKQKITKRKARYFCSHNMYTKRFVCERKFLTVKMFFFSSSTSAYHFWLSNALNLSVFCIYTNLSIFFLLCIFLLILVMCYQKLQ